MVWRLGPRVGVQGWVQGVLPWGADAEFSPPSQGRQLSGVFLRTRTPSWALPPNTTHGGEAFDMETGGHMNVQSVTPTLAPVPCCVSRADTFIHPSSPRPTSCSDVTSIRDGETRVSPPRQIPILNCGTR